MKRQVVRFLYDDHERFVIPAAYGIHATTGNPVLRGYQIGGTRQKSTRPVLVAFREDQVIGPEVTNENFSEIPVGYERNDKHIGLMHCQLP